VAFIITKFKVHLKLAYASILIGVVLFLLSCSSEFLVYVEVNRIIKWGVPAALLIFGAVVDDGKAKIRPNRILNFIGDASYSIYLTHVPFIYFFMTIFNKLNLFKLFGYFTAVTLCIVLTLMGGCIFYQIIEKPVLKLARRMVRKDQKHLKIPANQTPKGRDSWQY
jgi:peptidoglycan/LPS O-acetylase OafA/YrhL